MRLRGITLGNFKSFAGETEIPIGQITSLVGPNGAGKSNILDAVEKIAAMLQRGKHVPTPNEFFNDEDENGMRLGATFELSDQEQLALLKYWTKPKGFVRDEPGPSLPFRFVKYAVTLDITGNLKDEIWLSTSSNKLEQFICISRTGKGFTQFRRSIKRAAAKDAPLPPMRTSARDGSLSLFDLFGLVDPSLITRMAETLGSMKIIGTDREIPPAVAVRESNGISTAGQNLPNELNDIPRHKQDEFDKYMASATRGDPLGVEPRTVGSDLTLEVREDGLSRQAKHTDLGSGQLQTLILGWQMFIQEGAIILIKEPELHLHAERQRQVLGLIKDKAAKDSTQFVIETHSPVFLSADPGDRTILVTKDGGRSTITEIGADNVGLIKRELGITHADAPSPANILFAEGPSDAAALGPFLKTVAPGHASSTMVYSLGGAHNTKNLKMLIKYLEAEGRRMFVILDKNDRARRQVADLEGAGLLAGNYHFLGKNIEDEFDDDLVVKAVRELATEAGGDFALTAAELRASRDGGEAVAAVLERRWNEEKCGNFSKIKLAERIVSLSGGQVPPGIEAALRAAVAHFEGGESGGAGPPAGGRGAGPPAPEGAGGPASPSAPPDRGRSP